MTMLSTMQSSYVPLRPETGEVDGTLTVNAWDWTAKPSRAFVLGPEWNNMEMIFKFPADATADADADCVVYGWVEQGPRERICEISITAGTAQITGSATALFGDTMVTTQTHPATVAVNDTGNNRVAKLTADLIGYKYIDVDFSAAGCFTGTVQPWARPY